MPAEVERQAVPAVQPRNDLIPAAGVETCRMRQDNRGSGPWPFPNGQIHSSNCVVAFNGI